MLTFVILAVTILFTSALSGVLGMGGGLILMGVMAAVLPVGAAMVLHGVTQMTANGFRAWLLREHVAWRILLGYGIGAAGALAVIWQWQFVPSASTVYLLLGGLPLAAMALPKKLSLDATRPWHAVLCGIIITVVQCMAGVAGPLLDLFFVNSTLDRRSVVATKAITQTMSHALKILYFAGMLGQEDAVSTTLYATAIILALIGTVIGKKYLERLSDASFRIWSRRLILVICVYYVGRALAAYSWT